MGYCREDTPDKVKKAIELVKSKCEEHKFPMWETFVYDIVPVICMKWDTDSTGYFSQKSNDSIDYAFDMAALIGLVLSIESKENTGMTAGYDYLPRREYWIKVEVK